MADSSAVALPFESYPQGGRVLLGCVGGDNCRHGYGLEFMKRTGQTRCAYCGHDFTTSYQNWLAMALDHVIPDSVGKALSISHDWMEDCANKVLACAACNGFVNRYKLPATVLGPQNLGAFFDLRDTIFAERKELILARHAEERAFFERIMRRVGGTDGESATGNGGA